MACKNEIIKIDHAIVLNASPNVSLDVPIT